MTEVIEVTVPNVIPGTDLIASPGVISDFDQYVKDREERAAIEAAEANLTQEATDTAQEAVEKAKKSSKPRVQKTINVSKKLSEMIGLTPPAKPAKVNDKRVAALKICEANAEKNNGALARMISEQLGITYANAYFYSSRVFKRTAA